MKTIDQLNEQEKAFFAELPKKLQEGYLKSLPTPAVSRVGARKEKVSENVITLSSFMRAAEAWLKLYRSVENGNDELKGEVWETLSKLPITAEDYTITRKPGRKTSNGEQENNEE